MFENSSHKQKYRNDEKDNEVELEDATEEQHTVTMENDDNMKKMMALEMFQFVLNSCQKQYNSTKDEQGENLMSLETCYELLHRK